MYQAGRVISSMRPVVGCCGRPQLDLRAPPQRLRSPGAAGPAAGSTSTRRGAQVNAALAMAQRPTNCGADVGSVDCTSSSMLHE